jgi:hypothetical protein
VAFVRWCDEVMLLGLVCPATGRTLCQGQIEMNEFLM